MVGFLRNLALLADRLDKGIAVIATGSRVVLQALLQKPCSGSLGTAPYGYWDGEGFVGMGTLASDLLKYIFWCGALLLGLMVIEILCQVWS